MAEELKITIGADTSQMQANLVKAQNTLKQFQAALQKSTNIGEIKYLQRNIQLLEQEIAGLGSVMNNTSSSFNNLKANSGQATTTMTNLSRVVQDAPFGFMAISNNINPLLESFTRLKQESGGVGGALSSLKESLMGGQGIAFAVSLATSLLVSFGSSMTSAGPKVEDFSGYLKSAQEEIKATVEYMDKLLEQQQKLGDVYFKTNYGIRNLNDQYDSQNKTIRELGVQSQVYANQIDLINNKTLPRLQDNLATAQAKLDQFKYSWLYGTNRSSWITDLEAINKLPTRTGYDNLIKAVDEAEKAIADQYAKLDQINADYEINVINLKNAETDLANLKEDDAKKESIRKTKEIAKLNTISKELEKLKEIYRDIARFSIVMSEANQTMTAPGFLNKKDVLVGGESLMKEYEAIINTVETLVKEFNLDENNKIVIQLSSDAQRLKTLKNLNDFFDQAYSAAEENINKIRNQAAEIPTKLMTKSFEQWKKNYDKYTEQQKAYVAKKSQEYTSTIIGLSQDSAAQIGAVLGQGLYAAITGQSNGLISAFQGLFTLFGDAVIQLGKYAILYSGAIESLKKALAGAQGLTGIAVGIGLIALGTLIKAAMNGLGKTAGFAVGTRFAPGGMALVGERGPELVNIPRGSQVIPAAQTSQMMGGVGGSIEVFGVLRGQDIYFSNKKYGQTYNRQT